MATKTSTAALVAGILLLSASSSAHAQLGDLIDKVLGSKEQAPAAGAGGSLDPALQRAQQGTTSAAVAGAAPPVRPVRDIRPEMQPDRDCTRPQERFNILDKLIDFGGTAAQLRLQRLVETDFKYSDLTPEDKLMLSYIAQTTIWVPIEVETELGSASTGFFDWFRTGEDLTELEEAAANGAIERLKQLRDAASDFPAEISLKVDKSLPDGAFAHFGGVIEVSGNFLNAFEQDKAAADFVLAHELSHVYKRHPLKYLQFTMIATADGWELGRKVLKVALERKNSNLIRDGIYLIKIVPELIDFTRKLKLKFGRDQELEADACSTVWLKAIGSDPLTAWTSFRATLGTRNESPASYSASHPTDSERDKRIRDRIRQASSPTKASPAKKGGAKASKRQDSPSPEARR